MENNTRQWLKQKLNIQIPNEPQLLQATDRSRIWRIEGPSGSFIVKQSLDDLHSPMPERELFSRELASLALLNALFVQDIPVPKLYASSIEHRLLVMEDVGDAAATEQLLFGQNQQAAIQVIEQLGHALGRIHAATKDRQHDFQSKRNAVYPTDANFNFDHMDAPWRLLLEAVNLKFDMTQMLDELTIIKQALMEPGHFGGLIHGDPCPGNIILREGRIVLVDFEWAAYGHVSLDACFARMTFPTCWQARPIPEAVQRIFESAYRQEIASVHPDVLDDAGFARLLIPGMIFQFSGTLPRYVPVVIQNQSAPIELSIIRANFLARLRGLAQTLEEADEMPVIRKIVADLHRTLEAQWDIPKNISFPAFSNNAFHTG